MVAILYTLVDVNGVSHALDGSLGVWVATGAKGLGMPGISIPTDKLPYSPGGRARRISTPASAVDVPLHFEVASAVALEQALDDFSGWVLPGTESVAAPKTVKLQVRGSDGTIREIEGVCTGDFDSDDAQDGWGVVSQRAVLSLLVPDPYWSDTTDTIVTFSSTPPTSASWWPYYPYNLAPTAVFSTQDVTLGGQIEAWPVWTITGPCSAPTVRNLTTGNVFGLTVTLAAGNSLTIDTRPQHKSVRLADGTNLWPQALAGSALWPLGVGLNSVRVEMSETTLATSASLTYRRRWARARRR